ncbi:MAG: MEDS domain-containing protein [Methanotrichaceae archaeon]
MNAAIRRSGIDVIGDIPWGTHFCQFYETPQDLIDILVPYFREGLAANEFCMWVTSEPLKVDEAKAALRAEVPDLDGYVDKGQIEILDYSQWYTRSGKFSADEVLAGWVDKLAAAQKQGYQGLRLTGNTFWLERVDWENFTKYEEMINSVIGRYPMLAICTYSLQKCSAVEMLDVVANHQFALIKRSGTWEIVESAEHKKTEQALRQSEERWSGLYHSMVEGVALHEIVYDQAERPADYIIVDVNPSFERITRISRDKAMDQRASVLYGTGKAPFLDIYARVASSGKSESFEVYFEPMRKYFSISVFSQALGKFATVFSDITERKRMEESLQEKQEELEAQSEELEAQNEELRTNNEELAEVTGRLQESEERFRATFEQAAVGIEMLSLDGRFLRGNAMLNEILGYSQEELLDLNFADITHPDDLARELLLLDDLLARRIGYYTIEKRYMCKDGQSVWVRVTSSLADTSDPYRISIIEDITDRKNIEEKLRNSERLYRAIGESIDYGVWVCAPDGRNIYASESFLKLVGQTQEQCSNFGWGDVLHPDDAERTIAAWKECVKTGGFWDIEHRFRGVDGNWHDILARGVPVRNERDEIIYWAGINLDISRLKHAEKELRKTRDKLEQMVQERTAELSNAKENLEVINEELQVEISEHEKTEKELISAKEAAEAAAEAKAAFLANMSHELRTPLNAVIGFSSLLLDDNLTETQKEYIDSIRNGGQALLSIISDILELSKAEKDKISIECRPFSLKHCIEESLDLVAIQAEQKGLNMDYTIRHGTPDIIISDHDRLRQVLVNLLSNAVKFTDIGDISVSVSSKVNEGNKRQITFAVKDTGIGMPQDKMDRLFKPFTQLEYTMSRKRDGAGLGLAICKKHVELMGGEIWAESVEGRGSTFKFTIQAEVASNKQQNLKKEDRRSAAYEGLSGQKPLAILVADDIPSNQKVLVEMLKGLGYRADAVADGLEVLQALQIRPYDLILMDIRMPEMDGLTATREIRKLWPNTGPKVVAITAFAMDGDKEKFMEAGMDGYIAKPVKSDDLARLLGSM